MKIWRVVCQEHAYVLDKQLARSSASLCNAGAWNSYWHRY